MNSKLSYRAASWMKQLNLGLLLLLSGNAFSLDLATILENTAVTPPARVAFQEERHNPLLKEPIILTGYLEYIEEGQLRKVVETPFKESYLVTRDNIEVERDGKTRRLSLSKSKPLRAMLGGIEAILAGQMDKISSLFRTELSGTEKCWSLRLEPVSSKVAKHLTAMSVSGNEKATTRIRIDMQKGEWSVMSIQVPTPES